MVLARQKQCTYDDIENRQTPPLNVLLALASYILAKQSRSCPGASSLVEVDCRLHNLVSVMHGLAHHGE